MRFKIISFLLLLISLAKSSRESCVYKQEENSLQCDDVAFSTAITQFSDVKDVVSSAVFRACDKSTLQAGEIQFPNLQKLTISCNIESLTPNAFFNLNNLRSLSLNENKITTIPNNLYQPLRLSLEVLQLSQNRLRNPTVDTFYYLENLHTLDISFNRITNLDLGVLDVLKNLKYLNISYNGLFNLPLGVFDEVPDLQVLDLTHNNLHDIPLGIFDQTIQLKELFLRGNGFSELIKLGALDALRNLEHLELSSSKLKDLPLGIFDQLKQLKHLDLSGNALKNLTLGLFDELQMLVTLKLSRCNLQGITNGLFDKNKLLIDLDLFSNEITTLTDGTFDDTKRLKFLNLSHNNLEVLPTNLFQQTKLEVLDLSFNQIERLQPGLLNVETLWKIVVKNNRIEFLDADAFAAKDKPLRYIDISGNRLVCLEAAFFKQVVNLERFNIVGNPWDCKQLNEMIALMTSRFISYRTRDYFQGQKPVCVSPEETLKQCAYDKVVFDTYYELFSSG